MITSTIAAEKRESGSFILEDDSDPIGKLGIRTLSIAQEQKKTTPAFKVSNERKSSGSNLSSDIISTDSESSEGTEQSLAEFSLADKFHNLAQKPDPQDLKAGLKYFDYQAENYAKAFDYLINDLRTRFDRFRKKYPDLKAFKAGGKEAKNELEELSTNKIGVFLVLRRAADIPDRDFIEWRSSINIFAKYSTTEIERWKDTFYNINQYLAEKVLIDPKSLYQKQNLNKLKKFKIKISKPHKQILKNPFKKKKEDVENLDDLSSNAKSLDHYKDLLRNFTAYLRGLIPNLPEEFKEIYEEIKKKLASCEVDQSLGLKQIGIAIVESYFPLLREKIEGLQERYVENHDMQVSSDKAFNYQIFFPDMRYQFDHGIALGDSPVDIIGSLTRDYMRFLESGCFSIRNALTGESVAAFEVTEEMKKDAALLARARGKHVKKLYAMTGKWFFNDETIFINFNESVSHEARKDAELNHVKNHPLVRNGELDILEKHACNFTFLNQISKKPEQQQKVYKAIGDSLAQSNPATMQSRLYSVAHFAHELNHFSRLPNQINMKVNIFHLIMLDNAFYMNKTIRDIPTQGKAIADNFIRMVDYTFYPDEKNVFEVTQVCTLGNFDPKKVYVHYHLVYEVPLYGKKIASEKSRLEYYVFRLKKFPTEQDEFEFDKYYRQLVNLLEKSKFPYDDNDGNKVTVKIVYINENEAGPQ